MASLEERGLIVRKPRFRGEGRGRTSDAYVLQGDNLARCFQPDNPGTTKATIQNDQGDTVVVGTVREPEEEPIAAAPRETQAKPKDELFEAIAEACGYELSSLTTTARGRVNAAAKELRQIKATPADIAGKAQAYRTKYPDMTLTPQALTGNWPNLETARRKIATLQRHCQLCGLDVTLPYHESECANEAAARNPA
jgi:hypothetical protein